MLRNELIDDNPEIISPSIEKVQKSFNILKQYLMLHGKSSLLELILIKKTKMNNLWIVNFFKIFFYLCICLTYGNENIVFHVNGTFSWKNCNNQSTSINFAAKVCKGNCKTSETNRLIRLMSDIEETNSDFYQLSLSFTTNGICNPGTLKQKCRKPKDCKFATTTIYDSTKSTIPIYNGQLNFRLLQSGEIRIE
uniref:Uncharacterized protein n=1 Tax=Strongyloides venezuelensis TaxID=75913 RepID=A0A0K0FQY5_STRVS